MEIDNNSFKETENAILNKQYKSIKEIREELKEEREFVEKYYMDIGGEG